MGGIARPGFAGQRVGDVRGGSQIFLVTGKEIQPLIR
jgi:hypothetical protein